jgi:hypothetical protein
LSALPREEGAMSALAPTNGLRAVIEQAGGSLKDFTVLSPQVDHYGIDTPANHVVGKWFAAQMQRLNLQADLPADRPEAVRP